MNHLTQIPDLSFSLNKDGSIDLEQSAGCGEVDRINLHACHVRHLFELAGHLLPTPPASELAKSLAEQLCMLKDGIENEIGRSPGIDNLYFQAATVVDMLPMSIYPHWMYAKEEPGPPPSESNPRPAIVTQPDFQLTHPTSKETP